jgi:DNA-binding response OmpR family regulator
LNLFVISASGQICASGLDTGQQTVYNGKKRKYTATAVRFNNSQTFVCYNNKILLCGGPVTINILVVEDDADLNKIACRYLSDAGYAATGALTASEAYDKMYGAIFDLIVSDIMMPGIDGFEFAETVRGLNETIPIMFMTVRDDFASKQRGFRLGVDDYMVKPVNMDELTLRVGALLRRANIAAEKKLTVGALTLNTDATSAEIGGMEIPVTVREFNILYKLLSYPNKTFSRQQLMDEFWGIDSDTTPRAVDVYITKLRDKFSGCADFKIVAVHGLGYKAVIAVEK